MLATGVLTTYHPLRQTRKDKDGIEKSPVKALHPQLEP